MKHHPSKPVPQIRRNTLPSWAVFFLLVLALASMGMTTSAAAPTATPVATATVKQSSAQPAATATVKATNTVTPTVAITATKVPPTAVPPSATAVPPTATKAPAVATAIPPTSTAVPPTATKMPATVVPPTATTVPPTAVPTGPDVPILVKFKSTATTADMDAAIRTAGGKSVRDLKQIRTRVINVPQSAQAAIVAAFAKNPAVERTTAAIKVKQAGTPNDPGYAQQWALPKMGWDKAYGVVNISGSSTIAVLDTGVDATHPDLASRMIAGTSLFSGGNPNTDPNGHGTALAGIAAAIVNNGTGMAGVAYGNTSIMPVQVLQADGTGYDSDVVAGVLYAADNGAQVILMGFYSPDYSAALADALGYAWGKGAVLVAATGNDRSSAPTYPAGMPNVIGAAATDQNDNLGANSNTGSAAVGAPGVSIYTTQPGGKYGTVSGTSAASAQVAGLAALLTANGKNNADASNQIRAATDPIAGQSFGRINVAKALGAPVTPPPTATRAPTPTPGATPIYKAGLSVGTYDQCANNLGVGYPPLPPGFCQWINGNLQQSNSVYAEGDATVQRLWLTGLVPGSTHTVTFDYATTKGGKHAYDFLTTWNWSENWITLADRCTGIGGCTTAAETYTPIPNDPNVPSGILPPAGAGRQFTMRGGTLAGAAYATPIPFTGSYTSDSTTRITITFTVASSGPMCSTAGCDVALWFGAHVARTDQWTMYNGTTGAGSISGSPYHVSLALVDGASAGSRDNQMASSAVPPNGTIVIVKNAVPTGPQSFSFNLSGGNGLVNDNFTLQNTGTPPNSQTFSEPPGTYTATELNIPTGWALTNLVCTVAGTGGSSTTVALASATATITLKSNDTVTCTYTDTNNKDLTVTKTATAAFKRAYAWTIAKSVDKTTINIASGGTATFNYTVAATPNGYTDSGWAVSGKITVANANAYAVTGVNVTDAINNGGVCTVTNGTNLTVPANGNVVLDYSCTYAAAPSPAAGTNTATATWSKTANNTPNGSATGTAGVDFSTVTPAETNKTITVVDDKTDPANPVTLGTATWGATATTFSYSLTESGVAGTCTSYTNTAKISETGQTASQTVKVCVGADLTVSKTATTAFTRTYKWGIAKSVDKTTVNIAPSGTATFNYTVSVTHDAGTDSAWGVTGKITVSNPNDWEAITADVTDAVNNGGSCTVTNGTNVTVPAKGNVVLDYSCTYAAAPSPAAGTNTATATWTAATYYTPSGTASGSAAVAFTTPTPIVDGSVTVTDTLGGTLGTVSYTDPSPTTFMYSHSFAGDPGGTCTSHNNTATFTTNTTGTTGSSSATVQVCVGKDLTVSKTAVPSFTRTYKWSIAKSVDKTTINIALGGTATFNYTVSVTHDAGTDSAWGVTGQITVANPNDWEDIVANVADALDKGGTCTVTGGTNVTIPAGKSVTLAYSCTSDGTSTNNTATATWDASKYSTPTGAASGSASFAFTTPTTIVDGSVTVTDTLGGTLGTVSYTDPSPTTFTYLHAFTGDPGGTCTNHNNTATFTTNTSGTTGSASASVKVCVGLDLTVSKTAAGTFNRTYPWDIKKAVDKTSVNIANGGTATFNYTVDVAQTGISDSGWTLSGKITLTNPNDWEDITLTTLSDVVDNGGICNVAVGPYVVPKSGSLDVSYSCTYASAPTSYSGKNTATATWDAAAAFTPTGSASGSANFALTQLGSTNKTVTVTDTLGGSLGSVTATDAVPFATAMFKYSHDFKGVGGTCTTYDNTATITETKQTASKTVTVCVGLDLTISKTAAGTFDRTYLWKISKDVNQTLVKIAEGGSYAFQYTVVAEQTGISDSGWKLSGVITLSNPNDWEAITLTRLSDVVDNGGTCTVAAAGPYVVAKSGTLDVNYSCTYSAATALSGTNTATATWDKAAYFTPTDTAIGTKAFTLSQLGSTNKTVHVTDSYGGALGTVTATDAAPFASGTFTYKRTESGVAGTCTKYDNTATITETSQTASQSVTLCVAKDLTVTKTATASYNRLYKWLITKSVDQTSVNIASGGTATFKYTVTATPDGYVDSAWTLSGKITVSNPNAWEDIVADVTDAVDVGGGAACTVTGGTGVKVLANGQVVLDYSCTFTSQPAYTGTNTATAKWDKTIYATPGDTANGTAAVNAAVATETNKTITVVDDKTDPAHPVTLGTATWGATPTTFTYSLIKSGVAGTCTSYTNTAKISETGQKASQTVTVCVGLDLTVTKTAAGTFDRTYLWKIGKSVDKTTVNIAAGGSYTFNYTVQVDQTGISDGGWTLSGKITVSNPNDWEAITVNVTDAVDNGGTCTVTGGTGVSIPASGSKTFDYTCSYGSTQPSYSGTNTATATWDKTAAFTPTGSASGSANFALTQLGSTNKTVTVTDTLGGSLGSVTATDAVPFATATFKYSHDFKGVGGTCTTYDNTATITETKQTASKTVQVCVGVDLTVSKTAVPTFTRTFLWAISKDVDKTLVRQMDGSVTFNYTVVVTETGFTDSAWKVVGTITIANPNDWETITANVADAVDNGGICTVTGGTGVSIPASGSKTFNYACTYASAPLSNSGTNTATATWDAVTYATPTGSATGKQGFAFNDGATGNPTNVNQTITVKDTFNGTTQTLGTVTGVSATPYTTKTFTYSYTVPVPPAACVSYTNTAKIVETGQSASQTVTVCKPSLMTDTLLCSLPNDQLRLIFTPDQTVQGKYKLNASNPGQFYYNIFYTGLGNQDITINLPYPWVTQGAVPIHVYPNVGVTTNNGMTCLTPTLPELANQTDQVTLASYTPQTFGTMTQVTVHLPALTGGFAYINIHLDYGLKGTTSWTKGLNNEAISTLTPPLPTINDLQSYNMTDTGGGNTSIKSTNVFKKDPGIGGLVLDSNKDPVKDATVQIFQGTSTKPSVTILTDEDGWYMWQYKWTGKAATFTVKMTPPQPYAKTTQSQTVTLKANGYLVVNFTVPVP